MEEMLHENEEFRTIKIKLPAGAIKIIEAAAILCGGKSPEEFIAEAATEKANDFQKKIQSVVSGNGNHSQRGRKPKLNGAVKSETTGVKQVLDL
jgi:hypothetical protein